MILLKLKSLLFISALLINNAFAIVDDNIPKLQELLKTKVPLLTFDRVTASPLPEFYQIESGANVYYIGKDGHYLFSGEIIDLTKGQDNWNVTEYSKQGLRKRILEQQNTADMIIYPSVGPEKAFITVFSDVECSNCNRLHKEIGALNKNGVTVRYIAYPLNGPDSTSFSKMGAIWCAPSAERNNLFTKAQSEKGGEMPKKAPCDAGMDIVAKDYELATKFGLQFTPAIILADGMLIPGYVPADKLTEIAIASMGKSAKA